MADERKDKTTVNLDGNLILREEFKQLRLHITNEAEKTNRNYETVRAEVREFGRRFDEFERWQDEVDTIVFPDRPPRNRSKLVPSPSIEVDQNAVDRAVARAVEKEFAPLKRSQEVILRELHVDPDASFVEGRSVPPADGDGTRSDATALGEVKIQAKATRRENRWQLYLVAAATTVVTLRELGFFDLVKGILRH